MLKVFLTAIALLALAPHASADSPFCTDTAADLTFPNVIAERPGKVTLRPSGTASWLTTDPVLPSIEAGFADTKPKVAALWKNGVPSVEEFKTLCRKIAKTCDARVIEGT